MWRDINVTVDVAIIVLLLDVMARARMGPLGPPYVHARHILHVVLPLAHVFSGLLGQQALNCNPGCHQWQQPISS